MQGLGSEILKLAMCEPADALKTSTARIVLTVHDELEVETPDETVDQMALVVEQTMVHAAEEMTGAKGLFAAESAVAASWVEK